MWYTCQFSGRRFRVDTADVQVYQLPNGSRMYAIRCHFCDSSGHIKGERAYNPKQPQWHVEDERTLLAGAHDD
jgi:hypothetical protein